MPDESIIGASHVVGGAVGGGGGGMLGVAGTLLIQKFLAKSNGSTNAKSSAAIEKLGNELGGKIDQLDKTMSALLHSIDTQNGFIRGVMSQK